MTIDEAISHAREVAEEKRKSKSVNLAPEIISECELCAQEHEQLAEWLEELQQYRAIGTPEELQTMKERGGFTGVELAQIAAGLMKLKEYEVIGMPEECRAVVTVKKEVQEIVDRQLIAGKNDYKETFRNGNADTKAEKLMNSTIRRMIREQPVAYDVDKVVRQLEAYSNVDEAERLGTIPVVELADAIKVVKGGGVDA